MIQTSLRLRLILAFSVLVALVLLVGLTSYAVNRTVGNQVANLRSADVFDLERLDLAQIGLEIEGHWNPSGSFVASDIEIVPRSSRPRLRGAIQSLSPNDRTLVLYGVPILMPEDVELSGSKDGSVCFEDLVVGQRVEVTCSVENGRWTAEKMELQGVKESDKIKGTVTSAELDGEVPETLEIHGLTIVVAPSTRGGPESALGRVKHAAQMLSAVQECRRSAVELVGVHEQARETELEPEQGTDEAAAPLAAAVSQFAGIVEHAYAEGDDPLSSPGRSYVRMLDNLTRRQRALRDHVARLEERALQSPLEGARYLSETFDPFLQEELMPFVQAYLGKAEEDLGDQLRSVVARTATTTRVALAASILAVAIAAVMGFFVWRSISRPIQALHAAALRIGQGHLDTGVAFESRDEFGVLARSFNRMASEIATTTVSVESLERVFDSMAAALVLCDCQGIITRVNRATLALVERGREELVGMPFGVLCKLADGERVGSLSGNGSALPGASSEHAFRHRDGSEIPVSLSDSELRSPAGDLQGYVCVAQDLAVLKKIEQRLRDSLDEKEMLLREVHHRVKNNMQVVSSLLAMHADECDPAVQRQLDESQNRIRTIALIHEQLYRSDELAHIDMSSYLQDLASHILQTFGQKSGVQLEFDIAPLPLSMDQSLACGLLVNELVTNALKHAFPADAKGTVTISLREAEGGQYILGVADDGRGIGESDQAKARNPHSLGMSLVHTLARQLEGRVVLRGREGTRVEIFFPRQAVDTVAV